MATCGVQYGQRHEFDLMQGLFNQRMQGKFCDVALKVLEHCVAIHSCVLAVFSPATWFHEKSRDVDVIEVDVRDDSEDVKMSKDIYLDALNKIVDFIYTGKLQFDEKNVRQIKKIAESLQLEQVANQCVNFLKDKSSNDKCVEPVQIKTNPLKNNRKMSSRKTIRVVAPRNVRRNVTMPTPNLKTSTTTNINLAHDNYLSPKNNTPNKKHFPCAKCPYIAKSSLQLRTHEHQHSGKRYTCSTCGFMALKVKPLLTHLREKRHECTCCSLCNFEANTSDELMSHFTRHDDIKPFFCPSCDSRFQTRTGLNLHLPKHSNQKPYICKECGKGFKWKHALQSHVILHTEQKQHLCDQCGYRTAHQSSFKAHCLLHTGDTFKCPFPGCTFQAVRKQNLTQHSKTHTKEKPYQCEVCGHAFSLVKNLRRHARMHNANENLIRCSDCEFTTTRVDKLKEHLKKHHAPSQNPNAKTQINLPNLLQNNVRLILEEPLVTAPMASSSGAASNVHSDVNSISPRSQPGSPLLISNAEGQLVGYSTIQMFPVYTLGQIIQSENNIEDEH